MGEHRLRKAHAIAEGLAEYLLFCAQPSVREVAVKEAPRMRTETFFHYGVPKP